MQNWSPEILKKVKRKRIDCHEIRSAPSAFSICINLYLYYREVVKKRLTQVWCQSSSKAMFFVLARTWKKGGKLWPFLWGWYLHDFLVSESIGDVDFNSARTLNVFAWASKLCATRCAIWKSPHHALIFTQRWTIRRKSRMPFFFSPDWP